MSADTAISITGAIMIIGGFAITAFVLHLADVARKEPRQRKPGNSHSEHTVSRVAREEATNDAEIIRDRHVVDRLKERADRIERHLELT